MSAMSGLTTLSHWFLDGHIGASAVGGLWLLPLLACPAAMGLMMWSMRRGHGDSHERPVEEQRQDDRTAEDSVETLRAKLDATQRRQEALSRELQELQRGRAAEGAPREVDEARD